ncbi:MAG: InlB B-repeat-containing protein [Coprococcus sp.]
MKSYLQAEGKGTVSQRNTVEKGSTITIEAYPEEGYQFVHWTDEKGNPVSRTENVMHLKPQEKAVLKAVFEKMGEEADKSLLKFAMQYAEEQMADERYPDVIPAVRKAYEKAYKDAKRFMRIRVRSKKQKWRMHIGHL